jgi:hypothetical protein
MGQCIRTTAETAPGGTLDIADASDDVDGTRHAPLISSRGEPVADHPGRAQPADPANTFDGLARFVHQTKGAIPGHTERRLPYVQPRTLAGFPAGAGVKGARANEGWLSRRFWRDDTLVSDTWLATLTL